jgi:hypothetical protein
MTMTRPEPGPVAAGEARQRWLDAHAQMWRIRVFEEHANDLYLSAKMPGLTHMYAGQEAVAVGACMALRSDDFITSTHRGHGHCLAKGASLDRMFAELLGKVDGYCRGKGGSMHIADQEHGNLGANAIVGGSAGIATGAAMSSRMRGTDQVAVCFFGEGALGQGLLYEVMNMAQLWRLPVIYLCENNQYNEYTHLQRDHRRRRARPRPRLRHWRYAGRRRPGRPRGAPGHQRPGRARARGRGTRVPGGAHLPLPRPPRGRHQPRVLPAQGRRSASGASGATRSSCTPNGCAPRRGRPKLTSTAIERDRSRGGRGRGPVRARRPVSRPRRGGHACLRLTPPHARSPSGRR